MPEPYQKARLHPAKAAAVEDAARRRVEEVALAAIDAVERDVVAGRCVNLSHLDLARRVYAVVRGAVRRLESGTPRSHAAQVAAAARVAAAQRILEWLETYGREVAQGWHVEVSAPMLVQTARVRVQMALRHGGPWRSG